MSVWVTGCHSTNWNDTEIQPEKIKFETIKSSDLRVWFGCGFIFWGSLTLSAITKCLALQEE